MTVHLAVLAESPEKLSDDRDAEADQWLFHRRSLRKIPPLRREIHPPPLCAGLPTPHSRHPSPNLRHFDPFTLAFGAGYGGFDESHAGDAVRDARVFERLGACLS